MFTGDKIASTDYKKMYHIVKSKETLASISKKYGLSVNELKQMNKLKSNYAKPKQKLFVGYEYTGKNPSANQDSTTVVATQDSLVTSKPVENPVVQEPKPDKVTYYVVKKGDTMSSIARAHGISLKQLADYNNIKNVNSVSIGHKLKIPPK